MKRSVILMIMSLLIAGSCFADAERLTNETAFYIYLKGSKTKLTEEMYMDYARTAYYDVYRQYGEDEFEWDEKFPIIKNKFDEAIKQTDLTKTYEITTREDLGDYDFTKLGYTFAINEATVFQMNSAASIFEGVSALYMDSYEFSHGLVVKLNDLEKYNFLPMEKEEAKKLLQGRKNIYGSVNREVTLKITCKIASFESKEYKNFEKIAKYNNLLPVVGIIEKIEVYDNSNARKPKLLGELIKN